ncbi:MULTISPECIES: bifunctional D-glycero-beta-D-manno-heptose-7-phosphate kinase/D-glycero-beta-D-manno-heptose 1-phosphate adenylyltransferase HldE [Methylotenera]|uniref:bifunctional D-glycero-beta-D-manno-heptose-7-phosphate kinase/D-glycero-beta-D-manno-heptose 1-phosphate adenylyltransferase HldE n=1 Tax=Methylotenera TaxID=359407 RepID=UPI0003672ADF|nr:MULTISPECIES: bifunctional D-glycero-beta-D-manno-heptose-7-phosphate kinase/D-glycero-beta-D-manno-heptose 1-phosphate adenylyltransferase HldE [Methylotenera]
MSQHLTDHLLSAVKQFGHNNGSKQHALVIGDVMLDRYLIGSVGRISPEAPVPIVLLNQQNERAGGAANVAANLALLGITTHIVGCVGNDNEGAVLTDLLKQMHVNANGIYTSDNRPTIAKTRVLSGHQQMLRLDQESNAAFNSAENIGLMAAIQAQLALKPSVVILSDYAKGLLSEQTCQAIITQCKAVNIPVLVDPKGRDYSKYKGATALTPNKKETAEACNSTIDDTGLISKATALKQQLDLDFLAVTRGEEGITLIDDATHHLSAIAKQVFDVSGAGDTVIATLAAGLIHNLSVLQSLQLANIAAAVVVGKVGTVPISQADLIEALTSQQKSEQAHKVCDLTRLKAKVSTWKKDNQSIVFTNGCFDLLHAGHVTYLEAAKKRGDKLILGLNTDRSVSAIKGPTRPVVPENDRARVLAALESVDAVILFDEDTPLNLINAIQPNIIAKGSDYTADQVVGGKEVLSWGGEIALIDLVKGRSTSNIIKKLNS